MGSLMFYRQTERYASLLSIYNHVALLSCQLLEEIHQKNLLKTSKAWDLTERSHFRKKKKRRIILRFLKGNFCNLAKSGRLKQKYVGSCEANQLQWFLFDILQTKSDFIFTFP